jgi:hypothetical protein
MKPDGLRPVFVDTSGWISANDPHDRHHKRATTFYRGAALTAYKFILTTNLVIAETHSLLLKLGGRQAALKFLALADTSTRIRVIYSNPDIDASAYKVLLKYKDQDFSFCDAVSFVVMQENSISDFFGFDSHFETAGFKRAL